VIFSIVCLLSVIGTVRFAHSLPPVKGVAAMQPFDASKINTVNGVRIVGGPLPNQVRVFELDTGIEITKYVQSILLTFNPTNNHLLATITTGVDEDFHERTSRIVFGTEDK